MKCIVCGSEITKSSVFCAKCGTKQKILTEEPVNLPLGTDGTVGTSGEYVLFGDWPQTIKADNVRIDESKIYKVNGWECYKGSDSCYYVKATAKTLFEDGTFSNGKNIVDGSDYYFKLESIKWRILDKDYEGGKLLLSEQALTAGCYDTHFDEEKGKQIERSFKGKTVYSNNYEYSRVRAYLNGLDGRSYDVEDYSGRGFINMAFSERAITKIKTIMVDNGEDSTTTCNNDITKADDYICNNTHDKIFLLSEREVTNENYGFDECNMHIGDDFGTNTSTRIRKNTDYSKAVGAFADDEDGLENNSVWWLRSPFCNDGSYAWCVISDGCSDSADTVNNSPNSIVVALSISF